MRILFNILFMLVSLFIFCSKLTSGDTIKLKRNPPINQPTNLPTYQPTDENKKNCDTIIVAGYYKGEIKFKFNIPSVPDIRSMSGPANIDHIAEMTIFPKFHIRENIFQRPYN